MKKNTYIRPRSILAAALSFLCAANLVTGCGREKTEEAAQGEAVYVEVLNPVKGDLVLNNEFIGTVSPEEAVYVVPLVSAEVLENHVEVGDQVNAGDLLCRLDSEAAELQLASAEASYHTAEASAKQSLGSSMAMQDYQTDSSISQLEKQVNNMDEDLKESKQDYDDAERDLDDVSKWKDDIKKRYEKAVKNYNIANSIATSFREIKASAGGVDYASCDSLSAANSVAEGILAGGVTLSGNEGAARRTAAESIIGLYRTMKGSDFDDSDISTNGLSMLSNQMSMAQAEYQNASTQKATLEAQKDGYDKAVDQLEDSLDSLKDNLETAKGTKQITDEQVKTDTREVLDAQLNAASVGIQSAQMQLDMYTITAPISGTIEAVNVSEHGFASSGNPAYTISNKSMMTVTFNVSEGIRNTFSAGQKVTVDRNGRKYDAAITEIGSMVDQATGLFKIKATVQADGSELLTGSSVKVTAQTYRQADALLIPYDAVYYDSGQAYVYVAENGKAVRKDIETGIFDETTMSVISGLTEQEQLITTWSSNLRDGVEILIEEPDEGAQAETSQQQTREPAEEAQTQTASDETEQSGQTEQTGQSEQTDPAEQNTEDAAQ